MTDNSILGNYLHKESNLEIQVYARLGTIVAFRFIGHSPRLDKGPIKWVPVPELLQVLKGYKKNDM